MKGVHGLIIAVVLGLLGAALNFVYIESKTSEADTVMFVGIKADVAVPRGERFEATDFVDVPIPRKHAETLMDFAFTADAKASLVGMQPRRAFEGGELVLRTDMLTPPTELQFDESAGEGAIWIRVDQKNLESTLVHPGNMISFVFVNPADRLPGVGSDQGGGSNERVETIGPFKVLSVGRRLTATPPIGSATGTTLGILVQKEGAQFDANTMKLLARIDGDQRPFRITLVSAKKPNPE